MCINNFILSLKPTVITKNGIKKKKVRNIEQKKIECLISSS
jgi:hypothetical protein